MKRRRVADPRAQADVERHEALMADLEEEVIARNRRLDLNRCDMSLLFDIEARCGGDCARLEQQLVALKALNKK